MHYSVCERKSVTSILQFVRGLSPHKFHRPKTSLWSVFDILMMKLETSRLKKWFRATRFMPAPGALKPLVLVGKFASRPVLVRWIAEFMATCIACIISPGTVLYRVTKNIADVVVTLIYACHCKSEGSCLRARYEGINDETLHNNTTPKR